MAKKLSSYRVLSCTLAVLAIVAFIIACGEGISDDVTANNPEINWPINEALESLTKNEERLSSIVQKPSSSSVPESSSDGEEPGPGNGDSSDSGSTQSSSDGKDPSSASSPNNSSSSEEATTPSSSSESPYFLTCDVVVNKIVLPSKLNAEIKDEDRPAVKCKAKDGGAEVATLTGSVINWTKAGKIFSWVKASIPEIIGIHADNSIQVEIKNEAEVLCKGEKASCKGELEICYSGECLGDPPKPSSSSVASSSSSSVYVPPPVTSSSSSVNSGTGVSPCPSNITQGDMCLWNGAGDCWKIEASRRSECGQNAWVFQGGTEGAGTACKGGTFICGKDKNPPTSGGASSLGCCKWDKNGSKCYNVYTQEDKNNCSGNSSEHQYWSSACPDTEGACPN